MKKLIFVLLPLLLCGQSLFADDDTKGKLSIWLGYPETLEALEALGYVQ